ncbi:MAG: pyridoxal phosphate-dependent aminotransferase [Acidobacteria bacterium]|nr:pyridoxal phosphate-dependent aminotransferase [Acidobacteriota bacterium]
MTQHVEQLAFRMEQIAMSPTMKGTIAAARLRREGVDVIDLGAGEPDFPTPPGICTAGHAAIDAQRTKYTANMGTLEMRNAVIARYQADYGVTYAPDEVVITAGGKQALFHAAMALYGPGDEVITHAPGWPTITEQIKLAGARPVIVHTRADQGFVPTAELLLGAMTSSTRAIIINSPGNPTGALMTEDDARVVATEAAARGLWVIVDLCYERLIYDGVPHNLPAIFGAVGRDRLVLAGSASKAYAMTGWRLGWAVGPKAFASAANALQSHTTSNASSLAQFAGVEALTGSQQCVADMLTEYQQRRDLVLSWLAEEPRLRCTVPQGAFYLYPDVGDFLSPDGLRTSSNFCDALLAEEHVVTTPGEAFDAPGFLRLSYAASRETLREGVTRLIRFARAHAPQEEPSQS